MSWFWACFANVPAPADQIGGTQLGGVWPKGAEPAGSWALPLLATLVLLASAITVTWAHNALLHDDRAGLRRGLVCTILLGLAFFGLQVFASGRAAFEVARNFCGAMVFMATGYHGVLVLAGVVLLIVCLLLAGRFSATRSRGAEAAVWSWHLVDAAWLVLLAGTTVWAVRAGTGL